jgi:hypothetical protein
MRSSSPEPPTRMSSPLPVTRRSFPGLAVQLLIGALRPTVGGAARRAEVLVAAAVVVLDILGGDLLHALIEDDARGLRTVRVE